MSSERAPRPGLTTVPLQIAAECQSLLDNVIAQFADVRVWNDRLKSEEHQTTNLGVGSSNLSGRAKMIMSLKRLSLKWKKPLQNEGFWQPTGNRVHITTNVDRALWHKLL